jgi:long-chain acyl-CoA synthetase
MEFIDGCNGALDSENAAIEGGTAVSDNLARIMTAAAEENPDGIAVKLDDTEMSYALLEEGSARMAAILKDKGVGAGDRVGIMLPNVPYFPVVYYGVLRLGGVVVPMNPLLKGREVSFYLDDPDAGVLVAWHDFEEPATKGAEEAGAELILVKPGEFEDLLGEVEEPLHVLEDRDPDDTAVILYTSGTTGKPKGAELTHANLYKNCTVAAENLGEITEDDRLLGALPLFHSFGQTCTLNGGIHARAMISMIPRFDPDKALEIIERDKITLFQGVPTMYNGMLHASNKDDADTSTLRVCMSGGSAMPEEVMRNFEKQFGCKVLEGYGLSETSPVASFNHPDKENKAGSIGTPIEGVEMKLVDDDGNEVDDGEVGEIAIKGHNIMKGYWNREEATAESIKDGWFFSGDMGKKDEDGYFFIVDRKKELIIRGGYNVYPREIEEVLYEHPAVQEAAVIGVPDDNLGEEVGAAVVLKEGEELSADELKKYVKEEVAAYKYPRQIWFLDELPKGPTGKILKREIEAPDAEAAATE